MDSVALLIDNLAPPNQLRAHRKLHGHPRTWDTRNSEDNTKNSRHKNQHGSDHFSETKSEKFQQSENELFNDDDNYDDYGDDDDDDDYLILSSANAPKIPSLPYLHYYSPPSHNSDFSLLSITSSSPSLSSVLYLPRPPYYNEYVASGLLLSYFYNNTEDEQTWIDAIENFISPETSQSALSTLHNQISFFLPTWRKLPQSSFTSFIRSLPYAFFPYCPLPLISIIFSYSLLAIYVGISWDVSSVRSRIGIFVALLAQTILTFCSSFTVVSYFFPTFSQESIRHFLIIPYFVLVISVENISRLLNAVARTPHENPPLSRIISGFNTSFEKSIKVVLTDISILLIPCIPLFSVCSQVTHLCVFTIIALSIDLFLHATYFTAILSIDLRRFELEDLITEHFALNIQPSYTYLAFLNAANKLPSILRPPYLYIRHLYFHPKVSLSTFILLVGILFLYIWGIFTDPSHQHLYSSGRLPFFFSQLTPSSPTFARHTFVRLFEPIVIQGFKTPFFSPTSDIEFTIGPSITGSYFKFTRILSVNIILELIASLSFALSLSGVILKYMLPAPSERSTTPDTNPTIEFFSKDLIGFHTLDVLQVISQGSTIATVSLDHRICVWNAYSTSPNSRTVKPIPIPLPSDFWPVSKVVLSSSMSTIVIFSSRIAGIRCWDFKNNQLLYHIQDRSLFNASPIETFFSGPDLIVVTKACSVVSISETGQNTQFPIEFPSKTAKVSHAKRLLTPRIPERIICMSSENEITIGTHIGRAWRFRRLMIQESPVQFNLHTLQSQGVHDLSKYKPQPIPAPQAMMARRPMRPSRASAMNNIPNIPPIRRPKILDDKVVALVPVPAINMVLIATSVHACLFDAQTGIIVKHFQIGHLKPSSLRVFHSQPTHCRFCGCVSVDTLSIAYSDLEQEGLVICHTLTIDNRAKNSICIRVERDPRETRCLGFEATTERQHWIDRVEGWDTTDMNMIMGVRKKEAPTLVEPRSRSVSSSSNSGSSSSSFSSSSSTLRKRGTGGIKSSTSIIKSTSSSHNLTTLAVPTASNVPHENLWGLFLDILHPKSVLEFRKSEQLRGNSNGMTLKPNLSMTWEGWALSATGQVTYYDIPDLENVKRTPDSGGVNVKLSRKVSDNLQMRSMGILDSSLKTNSAVCNTIGTEIDGISYDRLLIRSIGPVTKYGAKSIAVAFGNVIKILYFGNEELLPPDSNEGTLVSTQQGIKRNGGEPKTIASPLYGSSNPSNNKLYGGGMGIGGSSNMASASRKWRREVGY